MAQEQPWFENIVFPALLRHARTTYGAAMRRDLEAAGYEDIPKNGLYVIGGMALGAEGVPLGRLARELQISKQSVGQLVDTLVLRGYLNRTGDENDRRKLTITLTERGKAAAAIQAGAREKIDSELISKVGKDSVMHARKTLAALIELGQADESEGD